MHQVTKTAEIDHILNESNFSFTVDYTEDITLSGYLNRKARDMRKLNFVFGRSNDISLSRSEYSFHGNLKFE